AMLGLNKRFPISLFILLLLTITACSNQPASYVNDIDQALALLEEERNEAIGQLQTEEKAEALSRLVELGVWGKVEDYLNEVEKPNDELKLVQAELLIKKHRYQRSEELVNEVLKSNPGNRKAQLLRAELY